MRIVEVPVFKFTELSPEAKEKARQWYRNGNEYHWGEDALNSLKSLAEHFHGKLTNYSISYENSSHSDASFSMPEMERDEIGALLNQLGTFNPETLRGNGDCKLTGYCADEDAIDGFRKAFMAGESDLEKLMQSAFETWLDAAQADCAWQNEDAQVDESIEANEYEFTEDGKRAI